MAKARVLKFLKLMIYVCYPIVDSVGNGSLSDAPVPRFRKFSRDILLHIQRQYSGKTVAPGNRETKFPTSTRRVSFRFKFTLKHYADASED